MLKKYLLSGLTSGLRSFWHCLALEGDQGQLQIAYVEALESRRLLSAPIVLDPIPRDQRDNYIAADADSANITNLPPGHFEFEYGEQRLVYYLDQAVLGLDNQTHVLTGLYQTVLVENTPYPLQDVPVSLWLGDTYDFHSLTLDSADNGQTWTGSDADASVLLYTDAAWPGYHLLQATTSTGSRTWRFTWNGHNSIGIRYTISGSITGDGANYGLDALGSPQHTNSHTAGEVIEWPSISSPVFSPDGKRVEFTFAYGGAGGELPNGYYDAVLSSAGITNSAGEHLDGVDGFFDGNGDGVDDPGDHIYTFFVLAGDANHDRVVNIDDYAVIDGNVNDAGAAGFINGDFNYDGAINVDDYGIIDGTYATQLPAPLTGPNQLSASAAFDRPDFDNFVRLQWIPPEGATDIDSWGLWRSEDGGVTFTLLTDAIPGTATSFDDIGNGQGLPEGTKYTYRMRAFSNELGYSETTNKAWSVTNLPGPITATISDITTTSMTLNWPDNAANEDGYEVWQERLGQEPLLIATLPSNATSYTITGLDPNTQYSFRVNGFTGATGSLPASATATTLDGPVEPTNLLATALGDGHSAQISWTANSANETGFIVERSTEGGAWEVIATLGPDVASYTDTGLESLSANEYRVTATGQANNSQASETAFALTDYGDGLVYSGAPGFETDEWVEVYDGVTAHWSGPWNEPDEPEPFYLRNDTLTLTLQNLPEHYGLEVYVDGGAVNAGHTPDGIDSDTLTLSGLGAGDVEVFPHREVFLWTLHVSADHTGDSVTLNITGSNFESGEVFWGPDFATDNWGIQGMSVRLLRYRVNVEHKELAEGETADVQVTAFKDDGQPASGIGLTVSKFSSQIIHPNESSVTTDAAGAAMLSVEGVAKGDSPLVLAAAVGGGAGRGNVKVDPARISIDGDRTLYVGQNTLTTLPPTVITLTNARLGTPLRNQTIQVTSSDPNRVALINDGPLTTNQDGQVYVNLRALKRTPPEKPVILTASYRGRKEQARITVLPVSLQADPHQVIVTKNGTKTVKVTATAGGQRVSDITLVPRLDPDIIAVSGSVTDANGEALIQIGGGLFGGTPGEATLEIFADGDEDIVTGVLVTVTE